MRHLDLFAGIGGFALAALQTWGNEYKPVAFCERDFFCQKLLNLRFPNVPIYDDIHTLNAKQYAGSIDIVSGGFPCQPFSNAGKRKGVDDYRYLWPEMYRVIREVRPAWVVAENVYGLLGSGGGLVFERICADLEAEGYEATAFIIPACAIGAPHERKRIWFIGRKTDSNYTSERWQGDNAGRGQKAKGFFTELPFSRYWPEVAPALCGMGDGLPVVLDGFKLRAISHRNARIKSLGNAIVPQVAMRIFEAIKKEWGS